MGGANPTIVATITAEDKSKAAIETATAALRELNKAARATGGAFKYEGAVEDQKRLASALRGTVSALGKITGEAGRAKAEVSALSKAFEGLKGFKSIGTMILGGDIAEAGKKWTEAGAEYEAAKNKVRVVNGDPQKGAVEVAFADKLAKQVAANNPFVTSSQALEDYIDLRSTAAEANGEIDEERLGKGVGTMARARTAAAASGFEFGTEDTKNLAMVVEGTGRVSDPAAQQRMVDMYLRAKQVLGNAITPDKWRDFVQNAKSSNFSLSDDAMYEVLAQLAQGNASRKGTEYASTYQTLIGGTMTKQAAQRLKDSGFMPDAEVSDGGGSKSYIKNGEIVGRTTLAADPQKWATEFALPLLKQHGDISEEKLDATYEALKGEQLKNDPNAVIDERALRTRAEHSLIAQAFTNFGFKTTVADNLAHLVANADLTKKDVAQMHNAQGISAADTIKNNPVAAFKEFTNAIENFGTVLTNPIMSKAGEILDSVAHGLSSFAAFLDDLQKKFPNAAKYVAGATPIAMIGGGGAMAWGAFDGLLNGFGLKGSATALTGSAGALDAAAAKLSAIGVPGSVAAGGAVAAGEAAAGSVTGTAGAIEWLGKSKIWPYLKWFGRVQGAIDLAQDGPDAYSNWGNKSTNERVQAVGNIGGDVAKIIGSAIAMPATYAWDFFRYMRENGKTYHWQTSEDEDTQKLIERQNSLFTASTGIPLAPVAKTDVNKPITLHDILQATTPAKPTEVQGTVSGQAEIHNSLTIDLSPDLKAQINRSTSVAVPLAGRVGTVMGGANGVPSAHGGHFTE